MNIITCFLSALLLAQMAVAQQTGSWGDQGNGKYKNPILESNYPDNDVIRVGDTFYMMSSTCHFCPGHDYSQVKGLGELGVFQCHHAGTDHLR